MLNISVDLAQTRDQLNELNQIALPRIAECWDHTCEPRCLKPGCECCWHGNFSCCTPDPAAALEGKARARALCVDNVSLSDGGSKGGSNAGSKGGSNAKGTEKGTEKRTEGGGGGASEGGLDGGADDCIAMADASAGFVFKHSFDKHLGYEIVRPFKDMDACCDDGRTDMGNPLRPVRDYETPPDVPYVKVAGEGGGDKNGGLPVDNNDKDGTYGAALLRGAPTAKELTDAYPVLGDNEVQKKLLGGKEMLPPGIHGADHSDPQAQRESLHALNSHPNVQERLKVSKQVDGRLVPSAQAEEAAVK